MTAQDELMDGGAPVGKRKAVVVDTSDGIRHLIGRTLALAGFEVHDCHTGTEAIAFITANEVELATIELVMIDMDGVQLVERLLEVSPKTKVLVVTGHAMSSAIPLVTQAGAFRIIFKPFDRATLEESLRRVGLIA